MKMQTWLAGIVVGVSLNASAAYDYSWTVNAAIPDANRSGFANHQTITDGLQGNNLPVNPIIASVVGVTLSLSGGWNGNLYAYLRYETGAGVGFSTLLNQVGTGPGNPIGSTVAGFDNIFLIAGTSVNGNIHDVVNPAANTTYQGDGTSFSSFTGLDPTAGTWSIFFADLSGSHVSTLDSWGLTLEVVPEPTTWALGIFGGIGGIAGLVRWRRKTKAETLPGEIGGGISRAKAR